VLSSHEQQVWDDVLRYWDVEAAEPHLLVPRATGRTWTADDQEDLPLAVVAGIWMTIALVLFGVMAVGLTVGVATALGWALWRRWPAVEHRTAD
jgi:hypothetical protein